MSDGLASLVFDILCFADPEKGGVIPDWGCGSGPGMVSDQRERCITEYSGRRGKVTLKGKGRTEAGLSVVSTSRRLDMGYRFPPSYSAGPLRFRSYAPLRVSAMYYWLPESPLTPTACVPGHRSTSRRFGVRQRSVPGDIGHR